jgi:hypothetical protein
MITSPNRLVAVILGAFYVIAGVTGLFGAAGVGFFSTTGRLLLGVFAVNSFAASVDILIGAGLVMAGLATVAASKIVTTIAGTVFLVIGIAGLFVIGNGFNILALNGADNVVHLASAVILLAVGLGADRSVKTAITS